MHRLKKSFNHRSLLIPRVEVKKVKVRRRNGKSSPDTSNLRLANDRAIHALGIESTGTLSTVINDVQYLRGCSWDTQSVAAHVVRILLGWRYIHRVNGRAADSVHDARRSNGARVLRLGGQNCSSGGLVCFADDPGGRV